MTLLTDCYSKSSSKIYTHVFYSSRTPSWFSINYFCSCCTYIVFAPKRFGAGTATLPEHLRSPLIYSGVHVTRSLVVCVCFVDRCLYFFSRPLGCLFFFDIRILITTLVSETLFITARSAILYIVMN